jgi:hypothetical protein
MGEIVVFGFLRRRFGGCCERYKGGGMNPNFFEGTQVEKEAAAALARPANEPPKPRAAK